MKTFTAFAMLCCLGAASAAPVQTFNGDIKIGDSAAGMDFDIDGDGTPDLNAAWNGQSVHPMPQWDTKLSAAAGGLAFIFVSGGSTHRFAAGEAIGPSNLLGAAGITTPGQETLPPFPFPFGSGNFFDYNPPDSEGLRGFAGFSFDIGGQIHHGWIDIELQPYQADGIPGPPCSGNPLEGCLRVYAYGYETTPQAEIAAGAVPIPASLPLLMGATALFAYRRGRKKI